MKTDPLKIIARYKAHIPVDVFGVIRDLGVPFSMKQMDKETSGWIERLPNGGYEIAINSEHHSNRKRFTAAHELGHYIYHRDLLGSGTADTRAYRSENTRLPNNNITPSHERQANSFAANLLMPREALINVRPDDDLMDLAARFGVSAEAMRIRLGR